MRTAGPEVVRRRATGVGDRLECPHVRVRQIRHVNVIAQARAVGRRVVVAEHLQAASARRRVDRARDDVDFRRVIFADLAVRIGARGVEVPQRHRMNAIRPLEVRQRPFDGQLRFAVAVDGPLRMRFDDGRLGRLAVGGAG